jgi:DNA repair exonuclease SbcCD ATPase subunit
MKYSIVQVRRRVLAVVELEEAVIEREDRITALERELAEADRRAGASERFLAEAQDTIRRVNTWRDEQKRRMGYDVRQSFDDVWSETVNRMEKAKRELAEACEHLEWYERTLVATESAYTTRINRLEAELAEARERIAAFELADTVRTGTVIPPAPVRHDHIVEANKKAVEPDHIVEPNKMIEQED